MSQPTFLSLFSGIGGLDLGLERAGWRCVGQVEIDPFCRRVLAKHWPDVPRFSDVNSFTFTKKGVPASVDLICGGFPCPPVSEAGRRQGGNDPRWLWPEFARIIREFRPRFVLVENVSGFLSKGFDEVCAGLAEGGFDCWWDCIPAYAFGAPHARERIFIIAANSELLGCEAWGGKPEDEIESGLGWRQLAGGDQALAGADRITECDCCGEDFCNWHGQHRIECGCPDPWELDESRPDSNWWGIEPAVDRVAYGVPAKVDRIGSLGNAVVPAVAEWIGHRLMEAYLAAESEVA